MELIELSADQWIEFKAIRLEALANSPDAFGETLDSANKFTQVDWMNRLRKATIPDRSGILAAHEKNRVVGICAFGINDQDSDQGYFWGFYVDPRNRGKGVGHNMLVWIERWLTKHAAKRVKACVAAPNASAVKFYETRGYTISPTDKALRENSNISVFDIEKELTSSAAMDRKR